MFASAKRTFSRSSFSTPRSLYRPSGRLYCQYLTTPVALTTRIPSSVVLEYRTTGDQTNIRPTFAFSIWNLKNRWVVLNQSIVLISISNHLVVSMFIDRGLSPQSTTYTREQILMEERQIFVDRNSHRQSRILNGFTLLQPSYLFNHCLVSFAFFIY